MEETLEGGRGPCRAVAPLEREREKGSWCHIVIIVSGKWVEQIQNRGSILSRRKIFFMLQIIKISSGAHLASCLMVTGWLNLTAELHIVLRLRLYHHSLLGLYSFHRDTVYHKKRHLVYLSLAAGSRPYLLVTSGTNLLDYQKCFKFEICFPCQGMLRSDIALKG